MVLKTFAPDRHKGGIRFTGTDPQARAAAQQQISQSLAQLGLNDLVRGSSSEDTGPRYWLDHSTAAIWTPAYDTLALGQRVVQEFPHDDHQLQRQILLAMLASPTAHDFPNVSELTAAVRIRQAIVQAAKKTALAFKTSSAERPEDFWTYHEEAGFTVRPTKALAQALQKATQPEVSGKLYSFSCYRASEYVILLALAQELPRCNPALAQRLQNQWEHKAIMSAQFHAVFLREYGSMERPVPPRYYVPGDRLWFRNPDEASADATGYEGSWVFYLGDGQFSDFWRQGRTYTLESKCLEIYHWRHATYRDAGGDLQVDEAVVEAGIAATRQNPQAVTRIQQQMQRYREPRGQYTDTGGCIDTTRESPRWVCPGTADLVLPPLPA